MSSGYVYKFCDGVFVILCRCYFIPCTSDFYLTAAIHRLLLIPLKQAQLFIDVTFLIFNELLHSEV
jgi:hypothetical protein